MVKYFARYLITTAKHAIKIEPINCNVWSYDDMELVQMIMNLMQVYIQFSFGISCPMIRDK